jgi:hypothetical protein
VAVVVVTARPRASRVRHASALIRNGSWARLAGRGLGLKNWPITVYVFHNIISNLDFQKFVITSKLHRK